MPLAISRATSASATTFAFSTNRLRAAVTAESFDVLEPNACDNGQRRLDAYEGLASADEVRLLWGAGGQVLHRPRPDVPTQRF